MNILKTALAAGLFAVVGSMANAASCVPDTSGFMDTSDVSITYGATTVDSTACAGVYSGNPDSGNAGEIASVNAELQAAFGVDLNKSAGATITAATGSTSGSFSLDINPYVSQFAILLKAATEYVAYYFDISPDSIGTADGSYTITGIVNNQDIAQDLSNATVWVGETVCDPLVEVCNPVNDVPVPASLPLLLAGLGITGYIARRKQKAA